MKTYIVELGIPDNDCEDPVVDASDLREKLYYAFEDYCNLNDIDIGEIVDSDSFAITAIIKMKPNNLKA